MRKLGIAGMIAAAALFAQARAADTAAEERREAAAAEERREAAGATRDEMKQDAREAQGEVKQEAREARDEMREERREARNEMNDAKKHPLFAGKNNFDLEGKIQKVSKNSITVTRDELPAATLTVSKNTKIELDGEAVAASQLKPGQDVKASFNLNRDKPEAVEIKAEKKD